MTLVIDNLVKRGLVKRERRGDDRRCIDIHLTAGGESLIQQIMPGHVVHIVDSIGVLTSEEQELIGALCRKLGLGQ